jgi:hypothetical protein
MSGAKHILRYFYRLMEFSFCYDKKKVIQALRLHFIAQREIKIMMILVNVFAIVSAILFYQKLIRPEPFLLGTMIWLLMLIAVWYILPYSIYKKSSTFKNEFIANLNNNSFRLDNSEGYTSWAWSQFSNFFESPYFFHFYFNKKSFFLLPKEGIAEDILHDIRALLNEKLPNRKR